MARVKRGKIKNKKRRETLKKTKGYRFGRKSKKKQAYEAIAHAGAHAFKHRRMKKRDFRRLWQIKINAAARQFDLSYSRFMGLLKKADIDLNRKMLAELAEHQPEVFERVVEKVKK